MSVAATNTTLYSFRLDRRQLVRRIRIDVTGASSAAMTIAHGITKRENPAAGAVPIEESLLPTSAFVGHRTQAADATNIYYTGDSGAGTTFSVYVTV